MNISERNGKENHKSPINIEADAEASKKESPSAEPSSINSAPQEKTDSPNGVPVSRYATRAELEEKAGGEKGKLLLLGGGLLLAVLFFVFTAIVGKSPSRKKPPQERASQSSQPQSKTESPKGSVTPLMETTHTDTPEDTGGQIRPGDIKRTRTTESGPDGSSDAGGNQRTSRNRPAGSGSLGNVPSFSDTQQKWEEPQPYGTTNAASPTQMQQEQNVLKEPSLVFVHSQAQTANSLVSSQAHAANEAPVLDLAPGTRIQAKLETQISSAVQAPVVAVVEYTYALGEQVVIPAGTRVYGHLQQADRSGYVGVKFDELELSDGAREQIDAIGASLDLGPIKGNVSGKNTGKNFLVRTASGIGSIAAMLVGNNTSSSFSEDDLLRERVAENIGNAGDAQIMNLATNSRVVVSVPADTKIYVVFTKHEQSPTTLHKMETPSR